MRRRRTRIWLPAALLLACLALAWLIYQRLATWPNEEAPASSSVEPMIALGELPLELEFSMAAIEQFGAVIERPLFSPNRRPPAEEAPPPVIMRGFNYVLRGVLIDSGARIALLRRDSDGRQIRS